MKYLLALSLAMGWTFAAQAHESDSDSMVTADQIKFAEHLPQTVVVKVSKKDPTDVQVVYLKEKIPAGKKLEGLKFEKMAMNGEKTGVAYDSTNELDVTSSTSSWFFRLGWGGWGGYRPYYNYGYYRPYYNYGYRPYYACGYYNNCSAYYYTPRFTYAGYGYGYYPYYGYSTPNYNCAYYGWYY